MTSPLCFHTSRTTRRSVLQGCLAAGITSILPECLGAMETSPKGRLRPADRHFTSRAVESAIASRKRLIADPFLADMFERCLPNTLDTTVFPGTLDNKPDTYVITGDIDAMWLRDSSAQVWPYVRFAKQDNDLSALLEGVIRRQARMILIDPYANAFCRNESDAPLTWAVHDKTEMKPGVAERKWEVDSLCHVIRLAHGYWKQTGSNKLFDNQWKAAAWKILETFSQQQRLTEPGPYAFMRSSEAPSDTLPLNGYGNPALPNGMIYSMFRPSDDACIYPLLVPSNLFAVTSIRQLQQIATDLYDDSHLASACDALLKTLNPAIQQHGMVQHPVFGKIWAYEVDGYGNTLMMDDANVPSLLGLPYLGSCDLRDPLYQRTRKFVLSAHNPYFFRGTAAEGVGGPHIGLGAIWPLAITVRALTSTDDHEIRQCLKWLRDTTAGTGFMHETFQKDDPSHFTRSWFAWANSLFGELILNLADTNPTVLSEPL